jgi:hypothetical protein
VFDEVPDERKASENRHQVVRAIVETSITAVVIRIHWCRRLEREARLACFPPPVAQTLMVGGREQAAKVAHIIEIRIDRGKHGVRVFQEYRGP